MTRSPRCMYNSNIDVFFTRDKEAILGEIVENYHGEALTTSLEAWQGEILILQSVLKPWEKVDGQIIFEYDIPRLGKRIDVVLLLKGIVFLPGVQGW